MATLQYRGSVVEVSDQAVVKPSIASYRGSTYNPQEVKEAPKPTHGQYRGASWEA
tara:strand:- start:2606 stop:2770 length:165 start_codon:yes stop_codon:yes gene_type:complete